MYNIRVIYILINQSLGLIVFKTKKKSFQNTTVHVLEMIVNKKFTEITLVEGEIFLDQIWFQF